MDLASTLSVTKARSDDSYFGGTFRIWLTNESSGRCTTIRLRSNKGSYAAEAVEKLIELRQVPVGI